LEEQEEETEKEAVDATIEELKDIALNVWNTIGNVLATGFRIGRGREVAAPALADLKNSQQQQQTVVVPRPQKPLVLYNYEGNQFCRLVREVLTELDIPWEMRSAGKQSPRRQELAYITGGSSQCPYLIDPNTGVDMAESKDIVEYLYKTYARWTPPNELLEWASDTILPLAKPLFQFLTPLQAGSSGEDRDAYEAGITNAMDEIDQETQQHPVVVYTYDWSPFSQETKALLQRLDISFHEISLGREWIPGLIKEGGSEKRAALLEMTGQSSLPHIFIGGQSIGGLFSGTPGLIPALKEGKLSIMVESANEVFNKRNVLIGGTRTTKKTTTPAAMEKEKEEEVVGAFE
jgi:glutaredoxin